MENIQPDSKYCTWSDVWSCIWTVIKKRSDQRRLMIWLLLFNFGCYIFAYNGSEGTHRYLFANLEYGWNEQEYTIFLAAYKVDNHLIFNNMIPKYIITYFRLSFFHL